MSMTIAPHRDVPRHLAVHRRASAVAHAGVPGAIGVPAVGFVAREVIAYLDYAAESWGRFWPQRFWFALHLFGGTVALLVGPLFVAWLLVTLAAAPARSQEPPVEPVPGFESGLCPFERGARADVVNLDRELDIPATLAIVPCNDQYGRRALAVEDSALAAVSPPVRSIIRIRSIRSCEPWIHRTEPVPLPMPDGSRTPVLMFVGEYDTSGAAPEDSRIITSLLGNTIVVVLPAQGHTGRPGPCVQHITLQFWRDPARPVDTSCVAGMPAVRFATQW